MRESGAGSISSEGAGSARCCAAGGAERRPMSSMSCALESRGERTRGLPRGRAVTAGAFGDAGACVAIAAGRWSPGRRRRRGAGALARRGTRGAPSRQPKTPGRACAAGPSRRQDHLQRLDRTRLVALLRGADVAGDGLAASLATFGGVDAPARKSSHHGVLVGDGRRVAQEMGASARAARRWVPFGVGASSREARRAVAGAALVDAAAAASPPGGVGGRSARGLARGRCGLLHGRGGRARCGPGRLRLRVIVRAGVARCLGVVEVELHVLGTFRAGGGGGRVAQLDGDAVGRVLTLRAYVRQRSMDPLRRAPRGFRSAPGAGRSHGIRCYAAGGQECVAASARNFGKFTLAIRPRGLSRAPAHPGALQPLQRRRRGAHGGCRPRARPRPFARRSRRPGGRGPTAASSAARMVQQRRQPVRVEGVRARAAAPRRLRRAAQSPRRRAARRSSKARSGSAERPRAAPRSARLSAPLASATSPWLAPAWPGTPRPARGRGAGRRGRVEALAMARRAAAASGRRLPGGDSAAPARWCQAAWQTTSAATRAREHVSSGASASQ